MHLTSLMTMKELVADKVVPGDTILDVGSRCVAGGSYRRLFPDSVRYVGIDVEDGPGVDFVMPGPYESPEELICESFSWIISGQTFEHIEWPWETMRMIAPHLREKTGTCVIIAPSKGRIHRWPVDTFRYHPDGMRALGRYAGLTMVDFRYDRKSYWGDCAGVFRKYPDKRIPENVPSVERLLTDIDERPEHVKAKEEIKSHERNPTRKNRRAGTESEGSR